jgi:hypothetical protein
MLPSPTWDPAQFACLGRVLALRLGLASDDITRASLRPAWQQSHHNVPTFRSVGKVDDVLADLEFSHGHRSLSTFRLKNLSVQAALLAVKGDLPEFLPIVVAVVL